jgi:hypothetical protein
MSKFRNFTKVIPEMAKFLKVCFNEFEILTRLHRRVMVIRCYHRIIYGKLAMPLFL